MNFEDRLFGQPVPMHLRMMPLSTAAPDATSSRPSSASRSAPATLSRLPGASMWNRRLCQSLPRWRLLALAWQSSASLAFADGVGSRKAAQVAITAEAPAGAQPAHRSARPLALHQAMVMCSPWRPMHFLKFRCAAARQFLHPIRASRLSPAQAGIGARAPRTRSASGSLQCTT